MHSYLVKLKVGSDLMGAPTLTIDAVVNAETGAMNGHATITQALPPPMGEITVDHLRGRLTNLPMPPHPSKVVTLEGQYLPPLPPPSIGPILTLEVHLLVDAQWNGRGSFTYGGQRIDNVPVTNISRGESSHK